MVLSEDSPEAVVLSESPTARNAPWWRATLPWMLYPLAHFIYTLVRGAITGIYPYPFLDVTRHGYSGVLLYGLILMIAFWLMSLVFLGINRLISNTSK